jgi:uncharacterized membrane protein (UPF0127 family)
MKLVNIDRGFTLAERLDMAVGFWGRLKGLIGTTSLPEGYALMLSPCNSIHTFFMKYGIDVIFIDRNNRVVKILHSVSPNRIGPVAPGAKAAIELKAGSCNKTGTRTGDRLKITAAEVT